jgi:spore germination protein GerM
MKRNHRRKKKGGIKKILFLLTLIGIGIGLLSLFSKELPRFVRPWLEKRGFVEGRREVTLFFSDRGADYLVGEKRAIKRGEDTEAAAGELIREIIRGPRGQLFPTLPSQARLLSFQLDERGVARVNFNKAFLRDHPGGSSAEMMTVYSVVNSLTLNYPEIKKIQFLVEGKEIETIAGHLSLRQPISSKPDLIRKGDNQMVK